ncbi:MAG: type II toxin-antitoxin system VapC family toxin [Vicinamibacterales bacterium]
MGAAWLWRSEFRNILAGYIRRSSLTLGQARAVQAEAEALVEGCEYDVPSERVLDLVARSTCSAYDCEFVALAELLGVPLVTADRKIRRALSRPDRGAARSVVDDELTAAAGQATTRTRIPKHTLDVR